MGKPTLLFYINSIRRGGAERVLLELAARFAGEGYRSVLVTSFAAPDEYPVPAGVERLTIEAERQDRSALVRNLGRIRALRRICRSVRPAVLISFMAEPNFRAVLAARALPVRTLISVRNAPDREYAGRLFRFVGQHVLPLADGCVFQTEQARAWFPPRLRQKSRVIMNQVAPAFFEEPEAAARHGIAAVGRLSEQKDHALLIRAFAALGATEETLVIYGEGPLRGELEALVKERGLEGRVLLPGLCGDIPHALKGAKVFVLCSAFEGMPNALLEAMALGLPCVATDCPCGGPAAVIRDGENGMLIPVGDEAALTERLRTLLGDGALRERLGENARRTAESFRPEAVFAQWKDYVDQLAGGNGQ